jgi:MFS family permease
MFAIASVSALLAALFNARITRRLGMGPTILLSAFQIGIGWLLIPLANGSLAVTVGVITVGAGIFGMANTTYNITLTSLYQKTTPSRLLGRVNSSLSVIAFATIPVGAFLGGILGGSMGLRLTLLLAGLVRFVFLWLFLSPLRTIRELPTVTEEEQT